MVAGELIAIASVKNGPAQLSFSYVGTYIAPDGHRVQSTQTVSSGSHLRPGSSATLAFTFPGVAPGGSVIVKCSRQAPARSPRLGCPCRCSNLHDSAADDSAGPGALTHRPPHPSGRRRLPLPLYDFSVPRDATTT